MMTQYGAWVKLRKNASDKVVHEAKKWCVYSIKESQKVLGTKACRIRIIIHRPFEFVDPKTYKTTYATTVGWKAYFNV